MQNVWRQADRQGSISEVLRTMPKSGTTGKDEAETIHGTHSYIYTVTTTNPS